MNPQSAPIAKEESQMRHGSSGNGHAVPPRYLWWLAGGYGVWCSALVVLYALQAIGCTFAWPTDTLRLSLVAVFLAHLAVIGWMWGHVAKALPDPTTGPTGALLRAVIVWTTVTAFVAVVLTFAPPLLLITCI